MFTVQEISKKLNITTQSIYNKINSSMAEELAEHCKEVKRGNRIVRVVSEEGVELIANSLETVVAKDNAEDMQEVGNSLHEVLRDTVELLSLQLDAKDRQLIAKDIQIAELNKIIAGLQEANKNNQILLHREQDVKAIEENISWWESFKGKFK